MQRGKLKIGAKSKSSRDQIEVPYNRPETAAECLQVCDGSEAALCSMFDRSYRIWIQDRIGRPQFEAGLPAEQIQAAVLAGVPGKTKRTSIVRQPKVLDPQDAKAMQAAAKKGDTSAMAAIFAKYGIKAVVE